MHKNCLCLRSDGKMGKLLYVMNNEYDAQTAAVITKFMSTPWATAA